MQSTEQPMPNLHTDTTDPLHDSPGRQLRVARESAQVSIGYVASELHLSTTTIEALEEDRYEGLPSAVFVTGYLRSYARLLGIDPIPLLESYRRFQPDGAGGGTPLPSPRAEKNRSPSILMPVISVGIVAALGAGLWYWYNSQGGAEFLKGLAKDGEPAEEVAPVTGSVPLPVLPRPPADVPVSADGTVQGAGVDSTVEPGMQSATAPDTAPADEPIPAGPAAEPGSPAPAAPEPAEDLEPFPIDDDQPSSGLIASLSRDANANPATADAGAEAAPGEDRGSAPGANGKPEVVMSFSGPCWVDIRDATGEFKIFGEMNKGDRKVLGGEPPYSIILGNAAAVEVTIAGKPFDVESIARGNVARFDLDPAAP